MLLDDHEIDFLGREPVGVDFQLVDARHEDAPELSEPGCLEADVSALDLERGAFDRSAVRVRDEALDAAVRLGQELDQRELVVLPVLPQLVRGGEFAARHLKGDLHAAVPHVVVVLGSTRSVRVNKRVEGIVATCIPPVSGYHAAPLVIPCSNDGVADLHATPRDIFA